MPKIIIRENDYTQAGTPDYSNSTVLIAGFAKTDKNIASGTVFEFSTQAEFVEKIGHVKYSETTGTGEEATSVITSYGNKIAYELLGLGYPVIYKVITAVAEMNVATF